MFYIVKDNLLLAFTIILLTVECQLVAGQMPIATIHTPN